MQIINYLSSISIPMIILIIILWGISQKVNVFDLFINGAKKGMKIVIKLYPTLLGIFLAIGLLNSSGIIDFAIQVIHPLINYLNIPPEILPLAMIRPISGSASMAVATNIMSTYGVDSRIGIIAAVIMGSTETTLYTIAVYTSSIKIKKSGKILIASLIADIVGIMVSILVCTHLNI